MQLMRLADMPLDRRDHESFNIPNLALCIGAISARGIAFA